MLVENNGFREGREWTEGDELVIAVSGLAFAIGAADDDVCGKGVAGAEVYVCVCGGTDKGAVLAVGWVSGLDFRAGDRETKGLGEWTYYVT